VHRCCQNVIKGTRAPAVERERERGEGVRQGREGGVHRHKLNVGMPVSLGIYARLTTGYHYASRAALSNS